MFDTVQCQEDITAILLSADTLQPVNIKNYRKMVKQKELDFSVIWNAPRNGTSGAGILVEEPTARSKSPGVDGPILDWLFPILVIESPTLNFTPNVGTFMNAGIIGQYMMAVMHKYGDELYGTFQVDGEPMQPDTSFAERGLIAYRTNFTIVGKNQSIPRTQNVSITVSAGNATLASETGAQIFYTLDGSVACKAGVGSSTSQLYAGPFPVNSGDVIRATAFNTGKTQSASRYFQVT